MKEVNSDDRARAIVPMLEQLEYLIEEVEALKTQLKLVPIDVLAARPLDSDLSLKEIYAMLARRDEEVFVPVIRRIGEGRWLDVNVPDGESLLQSTDWNGSEMHAILGRVQRARRELVEALRSLDAGHYGMPVRLNGENTDLLGLAYWITQQDAALLQRAAHRLHDSHLVRTNALQTR